MIQFMCDSFDMLIFHLSGLLFHFSYVIFLAQLIYPLYGFLDFLKHIYEELAV